MDHILFVVISYFIFFILLYIDREDWKRYLFISLTGLILAFFFENITTYLGYWYYHSEPMIPFVSFYTWIIYVPYLSFSHFFVRRIEKVWKR
jgi:ABC-type enterochelin transport system permease subunit